jgi:hypothetical protein
MTDCPSLLELGPGANAWCRQFNPEGNSDDGLAKNNGGKLWVLGLKTEGHGVRVATKNGGGTEIFGSFIYAPTIAETDRRPIFSVDNASLSVQGLREISFGNNYYVKVRETRGKETRELGRPDGHGWIGWSLMSAWVNGKK